MDNPLAYFITFTCYGTWLHGAKSTCVDRRHNIYDTQFLSEDPKRAAHMSKSMQDTPYYLTHAHRCIILDAIIKTCELRTWILYAVHVRTNHVHLVVNANIEPEKVLAIVKTYASRSLNAAKLDGNRVKRWTSHGSTRYLWQPVA